LVVKQKGILMFDPAFSTPGSHILDF